jgi:hypothetical protein
MGRKLPAGKCEVLPRSALLASCAVRICAEPCSGSHSHLVSSAYWPKMLGQRVTCLACRSTGTKNKMTTLQSVSQPELQCKIMGEAKRNDVLLGFLRSNSCASALFNGEIKQGAIVTGFSSPRPRPYTTAAIGLRPGDSAQGFGLSVQGCRNQEMFSFFGP